MNSRIKALVVITALATTATIFSPTAQAQAAAAPTDPQIVGIVVAANKIDIDYAKIALKKSKNQQIRDFAQQMETDHSAVQKSVMDLGKKLNVTPEDSPTSKALDEQSEQTTKKLKALKGKAFDKAYIDNEVAYHKTVNDAIANVLIPNAQNAELKEALKGAQPLFVGHEQHAEQVQSALESK